MSFFVYFRYMLRKAVHTSFDAFIFSNIFISLSAVTLTLSSYLILLNSAFDRVSLHLLAFIFFSTLFIYNYYITSYSFFPSAATIREKWISQNKKFVKGIVIVAFTGIVYNAFFLSWTQFIFLIHLGVLSMLYIFPFSIGRFEFSLRKFPLVKIFILTYVWASATVFLPGLDFEKWDSVKIAGIFFERFLFILALAIPFDIRDYVRDKKENVKTIPGLVGVSNAKKLSISILFMYMFVTVVIHDLDYISISRIFSGALAIFLVSKISEEVSDSFYMFWIDGVMIFHFVALSLASFLF